MSVEPLNVCTGSPLLKREFLIGDIAGATVLGLG